jgi:NAD(P)-dependent dehydrogenase (short-subunit alcohol dehydrogenase family)
MPEKKKQRPKQEQPRQPGREHAMTPRPKAQDEKHRGSGKLDDKVALITGGDSGIGRAVAIAFAKEGGDMAVAYLNEHRDAKETKRLVEEQGGKCILVPGDIGDEKFCATAVAQTVKELGGLDILVNNAAEQHPKSRSRRSRPSNWKRLFAPTFFRCFI